MNARVARLRKESVETKPWLTIERARLITEAYRSAVTLSPPLLRAQAFRHLMENKTIYIGPEELIIGERGPAPRATPNYPEICCHSEEDLEILDTRPKVSYQVSEEAARTQRDESFPFGKVAQFVSGFLRK